MLTLRTKIVATTLGTYALHAQPAFANVTGSSPGDFPNSDAAFRRSLTLPLYPPMDEGDLDRVVHALRKAMKAQVD